MKKCSRCAELKPFALFNKNIRTPDGMQCHCKVCQTALNKSFYLLNKEREKARQKAQYEANPTLKRANRIAYYYENIEMMRDYSKKNKARISLNSKRHNEANKEAIAARYNAWRLLNKDKVAAKTAKRFAAKLSATPLWANSNQILEFYSTAAAPGVKTGTPHHVDHIVPLMGKTVCGLHCEANLQVLTAFENISKSNRYWPDMP
jgi:hypothetical protein